HYEGWGLPIAESIAHGTPCIASDSSSMPEIAGNIISYFTPTSTDECLNAIIYLSNDQHREKARKALMKYKPTTWDQTVNQIRDSIEGNND
ncbi:MAG: glycosyltransferase, partial [Pedobacter sp.]